MSETEPHWLDMILALLGRKTKFSDQEKTVYDSSTPQP